MALTAEGEELRYKAEKDYPCEVNITNATPSKCEIHIDGACEFVYEGGSTYRHIVFQKVYSAK